MNTATKYLIPALALAGFFAVPSAALAVCNGVGNTCSYGYAASYTQPYAPSYYASYQSPYGSYGYQQPQQYNPYSYQQPYSSYGSYGYQQPIYFPVYNTTFPTGMQQYGYGTYGGYGSYGQYGGYGGNGCHYQGGYQVCYQQSY